MRVISLQPNVRGKWFIRVRASNGEKICAEEDFSTLVHAERAFVTEGEHQPFAAMVVMVPGRRTVTVRSGQKLPSPGDPEAVVKLMEAIRVACRRTPAATPV